MHKLLIVLMGIFILACDNEIAVNEINKDTLRADSAQIKGALNQEEVAELPNDLIEEQGTCNLNENFSIEKHLDNISINLITSGRMNKPKFANYNSKSNFGFYNIMAMEKTGQYYRPKPSALLCVAFDEKPWKMSDKNQDIIALIVERNSYVFLKRTKLSIDMSIDSINLNAIETAKNITVYTDNEYVYAVRHKNNRVVNFIVMCFKYYSPDSIKYFEDSLPENYIYD